MGLFNNFTIGKQKKMEESKRQKQVGQLVMEELSDIFQREGFNVVDGGMVSISKVLLTPDLLQARVYLSIFQVKDPEKLLHAIKEKAWDFRRQLGQRVRNQLRNVPDLVFYNDDTLDYVFKMEEIFKKINEERDEQQKNKED